MTIDWQLLADRSAYSSGKELIIDRYYRKGYSTEEVAESCRYIEPSLHRDSVINFMRSLDLPRRGQGGANNIKKKEVV